MDSHVRRGENMKKLLAISLVLAPMAGCFIQTAPPPAEPAPAATTAAPAATPAATPAPTAEEPAKPKMSLPKIGTGNDEEKKTE